MGRGRRMRFLGYVTGGNLVTVGFGSPPGPRTASVRLKFMCGADTLSGVDCCSSTVWGKSCLNSWWILPLGLVGFGWSLRGWFRKKENKQKRLHDWTVDGFYPRVWVRLVMLLKTEREERKASWESFWRSAEDCDVGWERKRVNTHTHTSCLNVWSILS